MTAPATPHQPNANSQENVWTFQGYQLRPGEFNTAMVHFYRGELSRSNAWRMRLDSTTNWAVVTAAGLLTFTFGSAANSHVIILLGMLMIGLFLIVEARRYRYYELWSLRVRLIETDFFAAMLTPPFKPHEKWAARLADSLLTPRFPISYTEAVGRRLRRNYLWLLSIMGIAWGLKLLLHPAPAATLAQFINHADIGQLPGLYVLTLVALFFAAVFMLALFTINLQDSPGEVLSRYDALDISSDLLHSLANAATQILPEELPLIRRHDQLAIIITDQTQAVSQQIIDVLNRGVTALEGRGMYTGQPRSVLLCAVPPSEIQRLKSVVYAADENAFVVVNTTEEILGGGFGTLRPRWQQAGKK